MNNEQKPDKTPLIVFTTKWFGDDYLFNNKNCSGCQELDENSSLYKHLYENIKDTLNWKVLLDINNKDKLFNLLKQNDENIINVDIAKNIFNGKTDNRLSQETYEKLYFKYSEAGKIFDEYNNNNANNTSYEKGIAFLNKVYLKKYFSFSNVYRDNKEFESRKKIWKIKNNDVYAYRCLDLSFEKEVYTNSNGKEPAKDYVGAILSDIAVCKKYNNVEELYNNHTVYLILHRDDIDFPQVTKELSKEEIENYLINNNKDIILLDFYNRDERHKVFVFQHSYGIFPKILLNKEGFNINKDIATKIKEKIDAHFTYRKNFENLEKKIFKRELLNWNEIKTLSILKELNVKLY